MIHPHYPVLPILGAAAVLVAYGRWRTDVVAVLALTAAVLTGVVPVEQAFSGFASPVVAIIALLSIISMALRNSVLIETLLAGLTPVMRWQTARVAVLGVLGAVLSATLGSGAVLSSIMLTTVQGIRKDREQILPILLPISLLAIIGGLASAVGTLPNLLVWAMQPGIPLFGFAYTGVPVAVAGLLVVVAAWRLVPRGAAPGSGPGSGPGSAFGAEHGVSQIESYTSEVVVPASSPLVGQTLGTIERRSEGAITLKGIVRERFRRIEPRADWTVEADDVLVLECEPSVLHRLMEHTGLQIVGGLRGDLDPERVGVVEAIVAPGSELVGRSPDEGNLRARKVSLLAIGRSGRQPLGRLHRTKLQPGDVLMLQGELAAMPGTLAGMGCLTLAERRLRVGRQRRIFTPIVVLVAALALTVTGTLSLPVALLAAALVLVLGRAVTPDEIYAAIPWPVLVMVGALLPISLACRDGGAADAAMRLLAPFLAGVPDAAMLLGVMVLGLALAPLFTGPVALLVLAPFVAALATCMGLRSDTLLVAVALGASCEFVTLAGRRAAALVPGPERRWTVWRLLLPLYAVALVVGGGALLLHWPAR